MNIKILISNNKNIDNINIIKIMCNLKLILFYIKKVIIIEMQFLLIGHLIFNKI